MNRSAARALGWGLWWVVIGLTVATVVLTFFNPHADAFFSALASLMAPAYATVGAMVCSRHPRNAIGWLFLTISLALVVSGFGDNYVGAGVPRGWPGPQWFAWYQNLSFTLAFAPIPLVLLLFPNGTLPSRRWRPVGWAMVVAPVLGMVGFVLMNDPVGGDSGRFPNPTGVPALDGFAHVLLTVSGIGSVVAALACVVSLVVRFRRSRGEERQQLRWLAYAGGAAAVLLLSSFAFSFVEGDGHSTPIGDVLWFGLITVMGLGIPAASGIAILKYRLYQLDIVVKKALVFGILAALITGLYLLVVLAIPAVVVGVGVNSAFDPVTIAAAVLVALAVSPLRQRARRVADRLVYGNRATPYEVLSRFSDRLGDVFSTEDVLPRMARILAEGTGASRAQAWLRVGEELRLAGSWPASAETRRVPVRADASPELGQADRAVPVRHQGELLGVLTLSKPASDPVTPTDERLLEDLASQAGLVLRNVRLIEELRESRQRLVAAQDDERRRIERNIHDGAQQQLVALAVKLRLAQSLTERDPAKARELLGQLRDQTQSALEDLRDLARGIYPPLLADQGLAAALEAQARKSPVPVDVHPDGVGRYPQEVEAAVYFCVLEALQNVSKYADASRVDVALRQGDGRLEFEVRDDGRGFDPATTRPGSGLTNMRDRLEALGGSLELRSSPGEGTVVSGRVPAGKR